MSYPPQLWSKLEVLGPRGAARRPVPVCRPGGKGNGRKDNLGFFKSSVLKERWWQGPLCSCQPAQQQVKQFNERVATYTFWRCSKGKRPAKMKCKKRRETKRFKEAKQVQKEYRARFGTVWE